ncbi:MAG: right-handed parallel beta-helix repeat-containing protein [Novosphingobium sp.]
MNARTTGLGMALALVLATAAGCDGLAAPATRRADPNNLDRVLAAASGGETIVLAPGQYGEVDFPRKVFRQPVSIDASQAQFTALIIRGVDGVAINGGAVVGDRMQTFAVLVDSSRHISFARMRLAGSRVGISVVRSQDVSIENNQFDGLRSDGVNVAGSQRVRIVGNACRNFNPIPASYDPGGKLLRDGDHPDCIQGWSIVGRPPTSDVTIIGNHAEGYMQGIFFGNPGQGGYDRMIVRNNVLNLSAFNGIAIVDARDSEVSNNVVRTIPGARMLNAPFRPVNTWIRVTGERTRVCGNQVDQPRFSTDRGRC